MKKKLGILGGMGPLASAEFLSTLYRLNGGGPEQGAPACVLLSDPSFPDRTEAILAGTTAPLVERLAAALDSLAALGADPLVIACVTAHALLDEVPTALRQKVVSLIDLVIAEVLSEPRPRLLLTTTGTRQARIFERHPRWVEVERWMVRPDDADQDELHTRLYRLKEDDNGDFVDWLEGLPARYGTTGFVFGCTELHLLHRERARAGRSAEGVVDPLLLFARRLPELLGSHGSGQGRWRAHS